MATLDGVLAALGDVIKSQQVTDQQHEPTPTEFFAIIFSSITSGKHDESLVHQLNILNAVIPRSSKTIVSAQFKPLCGCLLKIAKANGEDEKIVQACLEVLGNAVQMQDASDGFWGAVSALQALNAFLACMDDGRYRVRKTAANSLLALIKEHKRLGTRTARAYIGDFCLGVLRACTRSEYKRSLYVVLFLESAVAYFPGNLISSLIETSLRLEACGQPLLTAAACRMIDALYQNSALSLPSDKCQHSVQLLLQMKPTTSDMEANTYFCNALASGLIYLNKVDASRCRMLLVPSILALVSGCETEFTQIHCAVGSALKRVIGNCFEGSVAAASSSSSLSSAQTGQKRSLSAANSPLESFTEAVSAVETLLQLKYQHSWLYVMDAVRSLFDRFRGDDAKTILTGVISKLADLYHAVHTTALQLEAGVEVALGDTLGAALRSCGIANFLSIVPLREKSSPPYVGVDQSREWLLSLLHANLKLMRCRLADFGGTILPAAGACSQAVQHPHRFNLNETAVQICQCRILQLWSLLPEFMFAGPLDVVESFPRLAKILEVALKDEKYPEIVPHIVVGLTHLAKGARDRCPYQSNPTSETQEVATLKGHAGTFVPAVLVYLEEAAVGDSRYHTGVQFIAAWASVCPSNLLVGVSKKLLQLLLASTGSAGMTVSTSSGDTDTASVWMAVVQALIPYMPDSMVSLLFRTVRPLLSVDESVSLQKRAYHVLDSLLKSHEALLTASETRLQILSLVAESLLTCQVSARSMRLRCMETLMAHMDEEELRQAAGAVLGEVLICQKDANKKTRDSATELLLMMIRRLPDQEMLMQLCSGMAGETSVMRSAAVTGLCLLLLERRTERDLLLAAAELLPTVCLLLRDQCPEETRAVLSFVRVCAAVLPSRDALPLALPQIILALSEESLGAHKTKFSSRIRAIMRKLYQRADTETLRGLLSEPDKALLMYIERRARKAARKKDVHMVDANRIDKMMGSDSEDDDNDDDSGDGGSTTAMGRGDNGNKSKSALSRRATTVARSAKNTRTGSVMGSMITGSMITVSNLPAEDPRLLARPKAVKASDVHDTMPSTLEDLLDDQPATFATSIKRTATVAKERSLGSSSYRSSGSGSGSGSGGGSAPMSLSEGMPSRRTDDEDEEYSVTVTADGRVVVQQKGDSASDVAVAEGGGPKGFAGGRKGVREEAEAAAKAAAKAAEAASRKRPRLKEPGEEYRSKKSGGDVWKRGMLEPHAYIPMDARLLNKKNTKEAVAHFGVVVKSGKKLKVAAPAGGRGRARTKGANAGAAGNRKQRIAANWKHDK